MKKILITGASGFVASHLINKLIDLKKYDLYTITRNFPKVKISGVTNIVSDLRNASLIEKTIVYVQPDYLIHLAAESSVSYSWQEPNLSFNNNVNIYLNLLEAIRKNNLDTRILSIGSSEEYGVVPIEDVPINETTRTNPISPYAVARQAQSQLSKVYVKGFGMDIVSTRSFNHFGYDQTKRFVIPIFIRKVLDQKYNHSENEIRVGDLKIIRDFIHVDDVINAYISLLEKGLKGEVYNVCNGEGIRLKELLLHIYKVVGIKPNYVIASEFIRPDDNPVIIGDNQKIIKATNWKPEKNIKEEITKMVKILENDYKKV